MTSKLGLRAGAAGSCQPTLARVKGAAALVAYWLAHVFCHGSGNKTGPSQKGSEPVVSKVVVGNRGMRGTRIPPFPGNSVVWDNSGGSRFAQDFFFGSKLVYLVADPAGLSFYIS